MRNTRQYEKHTHTTFVGTIARGTVTASMVVSIMFATLPAQAQCWTTETFFPQPKHCGCADIFAGSGSCTGSVEFVPSTDPVTRCVEVSSGSFSCTNGPSGKVGVQYACGDQGYDTGKVVLCALSITGLSAAFIAAVLATGGIAAVLALIFEAGTGGAAIAACTWCNLHTCGMYPGDPGTEVKEPRTANLGTSGCPRTSM